MQISKTKMVFFGGEPLGVPALEELSLAGIVPDLIVCNPDRPAGRGQKLTPPPVKKWAEENNVEVFQPESYSDQTTLDVLTKQEWDLFVVVAYNFILPKWLLNTPNQGVLNIHPSLLPKLRGASPIRTAIKSDLYDYVGVSIMLMDEKMDHGPIIVQKQMEIAADNWPLPGSELDEALARMGGAMLADTIPKWLAGDITPTDQEHSHATYCGRFKKEDAELALDPHNLPKNIEAKAALHHIHAFQGIGDSYFIYKDIRVKIKQAEMGHNDTLRLLRVTPAGKAEMDFEHYLLTLS